MHQLKKYEDVDGTVVFNALPKYHDAQGKVALDYTSRLQPRGKGGGEKGEFGKSAFKGKGKGKGNDFSTTWRGRRPDATGQGNRFFNRGCFICDGHGHTKARGPVVLALIQGNMKWFGEKEKLYPDPHKCSACGGRFHEKTCTASILQDSPPEGGYRATAPTYNALSVGPANRAVAELFSRMAAGESVHSFSACHVPLGGGSD